MVLPHGAGARLLAADQRRGGDERPPLALAFLQEVWQRPAVALGQAQDNDDGEDGEEGQDEVVEVVEVSQELHQEGGGRAGAARRQHQAQAATTDGGGVGGRGGRLEGQRGTGGITEGGFERIETNTQDLL